MKARNISIVFLSFSLLILLTACSKQWEPPPLNRPDTGDKKDTQYQLCRQIKIIPGQKIGNDMRARLFNCLNYDGALSQLSPIILDNELFDSLNSVMAQGDSVNIRDVIRNVNEQKLIQILPFLSEMLKRDIIPNMVPVVNKVVRDLSNENVLNPVIPSLTSLLQGEYFEFAARSSSSAIASGALGTLMKRTSDWLLSSDGENVTYKQLLEVMQYMFREREEYTPLLQFGSDVMDSGAIWEMVLGPTGDPASDPSKLKDLLNNPVDPIVTLLDTVHTLNRPNNRILENTKLSFLKFKELVKTQIIRDLRQDLINTIQSAMTKDFEEQEFRRFFESLGFDYEHDELTVEEVINKLFCYFGIRGGECGEGFFDYIYSNRGLRYILNSIDPTWGQNDEFLDKFAYGVFNRIQDEYFEIILRFEDLFRPSFPVRAPIPSTVIAFISALDSISLYDGSSTNDLFREAWHSAISEIYPVDLSFLALWNKIMKAVQEMTFDTQLNLAEAMLKVLGKNPPQDTEDGDRFFKLVFDDIDLVGKLQKRDCATCPTLHEKILSYYLPLVTEDPNDPSSPSVWSKEDLAFVDSLLSSLAAVEVVAKAGGKDGNILHALYKKDSPEYPLFKRLVSVIEFIRQEQFIQRLRPLLISAVDHGVAEAFILVDKGCQEPKPGMCIAKKLYAASGLIDLFKPQQGDKLETALINNLTLFARSLFNSSSLPLTGEFIRVTSESVQDISQEELDRFLTGIDDLIEADIPNSTNHPLGKFLHELGGMIDRQDFQRLVQTIDRINREGNLEPLLHFFADQIDNGNAEKLLLMTIRLIKQMP
ncbi:MAG TPA: hypothetical protein VJL87_05705 [Bdellovibrionota bacterium]|nr:hypothetical protein [Bdellovibrionota bacterium]